MRGRKIFWRFLGIVGAVLTCWMLVVTISDCKKENDTSSKGALVFDLIEIPDSEVNWPGPPLPVALKSPGKVRKAIIEIEGNEYSIFLSPHPRTDMCLFPKDHPLDYARWPKAFQLNSMHVIGEKYYRFATNSTGDKLFVRPYEGRFSTFEIGAGGRDVNEVIITGSLHSKDTVVPVGGELKNGWLKPVQNCKVPEGDYSPAHMSKSLDTIKSEISDNCRSKSISTLSFWISDNYDSDGKSNDMDRTKVFGIKIRKDKPFILDFSNEPEVVFTSPKKGQRVRPGDKLLVKAILTDPKLHIVIAIQGVKQIKEMTNPDGMKSVNESVGQIHPIVFITRADGQKVAEGIMPFG